MFDGTDVYQYRREKGSGAQLLDLELSTGRGDSRREKSFFRFGVKDMAGAVLMFMTGLLLGRAVLLGELFPFGPAFVASGIAAYRGLALPAVLGAALSLSLVSGGWELAVRVASLVLVGLAVLSLPSRAAGLRFLLGGVVFAALMVTGTAYVAVTYPSNYEYIRVLFESVFGGLLAVAFYKALSGMQQLARRERVGTDVMFCLVLLLVSFVAAAGQLQWGYISPGGVLAGLVVMVAGHAGGGGLGASAGALMGVLPGLVYTVSPVAAGAVAFAGLLAGVCRGLGRAGVAAGFLIGNILLTVYVGSGRDILAVMGESAAAALIFFLLPGGLLNRLKGYLPAAQPWDLAGYNAGGCEGGASPGRLRRWADVFQEISRTYERVGGVRQAEEVKNSRRGVVDELRVMVCSGCPLERACWGNDASFTKGALESLRAVMEQHGKVVPGDLDRNFTRRCSRSGEMIIGMNCLYRLQRAKKSWENCLQDSRAMVSRQLHGMGKVVEQLMLEAEGEKETWVRRAEYLKRELKQAELPVSELVLFPDGSRCEIKATLPSCGGLKKCSYDAAPLLSRLTEQQLSPAFNDCICQAGESFCSFRLYPELKYRVSLGVARLAAGRGTVSGDYHAVVQLSGGRLAILLSDGMGSGPAAAAESGAAVKLLVQLLQAGFGGEAAIRTVNSVMMGREQEDSFATVDMLELDLYRGEAVMTKIGAAPSFWVRGNAVEIIRSNSLPVGILDQIKVFAESKTIAAGDTLVMVTDGIIDAHREMEQDEHWVAKVLGDIIDLPPGEVADLVVKLARGGHNVQALDDMTVLALRIDKNNRR